MLLIMEDKNIDDLIEITQDSRTVLNYPLEFVEPFKNYLIDSFKIKRILENKITLIEIKKNLFWLTSTLNTFLSNQIDKYKIGRIHFFCLLVFNKFYCPK